MHLVSSVGTGVEEEFPIINIDCLCFWKRTTKDRDDVSGGGGEYFGDG